MSTAPTFIPLTATPTHQNNSCYNVRMKAGIDYIGITTPFYCNDGKGNFLLHKRSKNCRDEQGRWDPGGGQVEIGQSLEESVLREVEEEYGVKGQIQEQMPPQTILRTHEGKQTHWLAIPFFIKVNPKKVKNNDPDKIDEMGWFRLNKLPTPLHTGFQYALKKFPKHFKKYR
jgi:8-oxo-dGTP diphosphatase